MRVAQQLILTIGLLLWSSIIAAHEFSGHIETEGRFFLEEPLFTHQRDHSVSLAIQPEYYHEWQAGQSFTAIPFLRLDSADANRSHFDLREFNFLWLADSWELRLGLGKVFWGVTEFVHLVDIVNQTDFVEAIDGEEKLGQPMVHLSVPRDWGMVDLFWLPYFRERTFPGQKGRLRNALLVDTDNARYESSAKEYHQDWTLRYSHSITSWDFGIYHFQGTNREPTFIPDLTDPQFPVLVPYYAQIDQTGLDVQKVAGEWLFKLEALYQSSVAEDFFAATGGVEYSLIGVAATQMDLGVIVEYAYDDRGSNATTPYQNDLMMGLRLAVNDMASSRVLTGFSYDTDNGSQVFLLETSRRLGDNIRLKLEGTLFLNTDPNDRLYDLRDDDFISFSITYYF